MDNHTSINLPLRPYLKKYLIKKYGTYHVVSRKSWLGIYLIELLDKDFKRQARLKSKTFYKIVIPVTISKEIGSYIDVNKHKRINKMIDRLFISEIYSYINTTIENDLLVGVGKSYFSAPGEVVVHKQDAMKAMKQFLNSYNITEDDKKLDSLYRDWLRYLDKKRQIKKDRKKNPLQVRNIKPSL